MFENKPSVAFVGRGGEHWHYRNVPDQFQGGMMYLLAHDHDFQVFDTSKATYDVEQQTLLQEINERGLLASVIIHHDNEDKTLDRVTEEARFIRNLLGSEISIVIIPFSYSADEVIEVEENIFHANNFSPRLYEFLEEKQEAIRERLANRGINAADEMRALLKAYNTHYDDDRLLAPTDDNTRTVAEYIRCKLLPPEHLKEEFDDTLVEPVKLPDIKTAVYLRDLAKIRTMTTGEKVEFEDLLLRLIGRERKPGGGIYVRRISFGPDIGGSAIEVESLMQITLTGFGAHSAAERELRNWIELAYHFKREEQGEAHEEIITGLVYFDVPGFETPLFQMSRPRASNENLPKYNPAYQRVGAHLIKQRKMIPIDSEGNIVDYKYEIPPWDY